MCLSSKKTLQAPETITNLRMYLPNNDVIISKFIFIDVRFHLKIPGGGTPSPISTVTISLERKLN